MWPSTQDWITALYIMVPTYCTNGAPVIFGGGRPIDGGRTLSDGGRILGDNKTVQGFLAGLMIGVLVGVLESYLLSRDLLLLSFSASLGALLGDLAGAFLKRRLKIRPGGPLPVVDQLDFVLGALMLVFPFHEISLGVLGIMLFVTPPIHLLANIGAYYLGLKATYW